MPSTDRASTEFRLQPSAPGLFHLHWRNRLVASLTDDELQDLAIRISRVLSLHNSPRPIHLPCNSEVILRLSSRDAAELFSVLCLSEFSAVLEKRARHTRPSAVAHP